MRINRKARKQTVVVDFSRGSIKMAAAESAAEAARFTGITELRLSRSTPAQGYTSQAGSEQDEGDAVEIAALMRGEVERRGWTGMPAACLLSRSATSTQSLIFPPMPDSELRDAIALKLEETLHFSLEEASFDFRRVREYRENGTTRVLVLVAAARKDAIQRALVILRRAGLRPVAIGAAAEALSNLALGASLCDPKEATIHVDVGKDSTILNMYDGHLLRFSREVDTAGDAFTCALMRPIITTDGVRNLTHDEAEEVKIAAGYPQEDEELELPHNVTSADILPLMEPVGRRLSNEIRRSIDYLGGLLDRFDVDRIILSGPAGQMKGLDTMLQQDLETPVTFQNPVARAVAHWRLSICDDDTSSPEGYGAILGYSLGGQRPINLLPQEERIDQLVQRAARIRRVATPGALSLSLVLAVMGVPIGRDYGSALEMMERTASKLDKRIQEETRLELEGGNSQTAIAQVEVARGHVPDWTGVMKELSALFPRTGRIIEFSFEMTDAVPSIHLTAHISPGSMPFEVLSTKLAIALGTSPFFTNVHVIDVSLLDEQDEDGDGRFEATLEIVATRGQTRELHK